jgi:hypothetical protein
MNFGNDKSKPLPYLLEDAEKSCVKTNAMGTPAFRDCVNGLRQISGDGKPLQPFTDAEWKAKVEKSNSNLRKPIGKSVYSLKEAEVACTSATVKYSDNYKRCVAELVKTSQGTAK